VRGAGFGFRWTLYDARVASAADVRELLAPTTLPAPLVDALLDGATVTWLLGEPADVLAGDLAMCHPPLGPDEVRATIKAVTEPEAWRVAVVAHDRPGLLAATAGVLAWHGLSLTSAAIVSWPELDIALQCVTAVDTGDHDRLPGDWDDIGKTLRAGLAGTHPVDPGFVPSGQVRVRSTPQDHGHVLVTVEAPDSIGLLWAIAHWFETHGCNIEGSTMRQEGPKAKGTFLVTGAVDGHALTAALSGRPARLWTLPSTAVRVGAKAGLAALGVTAAVALRSLRAIRRR
jgi:hypothetical protein